MKYTNESKIRLNIFLFEWGGECWPFQNSDFFCLECFPKLTTGLSDERGGQEQLSTHTQGLIRREKLVEGGGGGEEGWSTDWMVVFHARVAWLYM